MAILNGIVTVLLMITALILIATVLLQSGESNGLPGCGAGGAETFFGKRTRRSRWRVSSLWRRRFPQVCLSFARSSLR